MKSRKAKSKTSDLLMFKLKCNNRIYEIPAEAFSQVSKKCLTLVKSNIYQETISHPVSTESLESFISACKLQEFKIGFNSAYEILNLSREWEIPTLEQYVLNYYETHDYLGPLLEHLDEDEPDTQQVSNDISNMANNLNKYLKDERLSQVHPEILFRILSQTDPKEYDQQLFVDFVMKLFEEEPEKAVPLTMMMNFDLLTLDQVEEVFQCREMHEQAVGYFIAASMSATRNKMEADSDKIDEMETKELQGIKDEIKKRRYLSFNKLNKEFAQEKAEIMQVIEEQSQQIAKLTKLKEYQDQKISSNNAAFERAVAKFDREILRQKQIIRKKNELIEDRRKTILDEYQMQSSVIKEEAQHVFQDFGNKTKSNLDLIQKKVNPPINKVAKKCNELNTNSNQLRKKLDDANKWVQTNRATLAAKIVNDQVKFNQFLRDLSTKYDVFKSDEKIWDLDYKDVQEAEKNVLIIEKNVENSCPINVMKQMQVSVDAFKAMSDMLSGKFNVK